MRAGLVVAGIMMVAATVAFAEEWPLRLEEIWQTPGEGEDAFAEGFPPPEIKAVLADTSIPQEDKEWLLNQIRHWAAYRTQKLWLDDGSTMDIPAVRPGDKMRSFEVYASRNMKYWLVRALRYEGPEMPPKPSFQVSPETARDPKYWEEVNAWYRAGSLQKAHWREVYMDVTGRIYWEKEFGPYDTHLEDRWYGHVEGYVSDDGEVVVKRGGGKSWFCGKDRECIERGGFGAGEAAALSADGSTFVVHGGTSRSHDVGRGGTCGLSAYDRLGERKWAGEAVPGGTGGNWAVVDVSPDGSRAAFIAVASRGTGESHRTDVNEYLVDGQGITLAQDGLGSKGQGRVRFSLDGKRLFVTYPHRYLVRARETETGNLLWEYGTGDWVAAVTPSREAGIVAIVERGGILTILSSDAEPLIRTQRPHAEILLSPNGALLLEKAGWLKLSRLELAE